MGEMNTTSVQFPKLDLSKNCPVLLYDLIVYTPLIVLGKYLHTCYALSFSANFKSVFHPDIHTA